MGQRGAIGGGASGSGGGAGLGRSIVLVGLMGAGKTSVGRRLAATLGVPFVDSDAEIEKAAGMAIGDIFERFGEADFRAGERKVILRLLGEPPAVIATGGGAFMSGETRAAVAEKATSVWLDAALDVLWERVKDKPHRPLLRAPQPRQVLAELLAHRSPIYALADVRIESQAGVPHDEMVRAILAGIATHDGANPGRGPTLLQSPANAN